MKKALSILLFIFVMIAAQPEAKAQCAMCTANAEMGVKNGNTQTKGLNTGVLYLLAAPFLLAGVVGMVWYTSYRKKSTPNVA
ncbi:hypothetical protein [Pedobacter xixiisoli]|uniref:Uncharacterized protein n=1 Tax=Pedobacter xixiisoli TaxID=1476464 RepID=A0A286AEZ4_9SPHI|nr:hypothetical protein [Pedobacter xixiisoli]SOD20460.1 hypothetical protein SAMN06297358_4183 [Pedobacter xixiisoli]